MSDASATAIDADVPCAGCNYNLRTLARTGLCPECGHGIDDSYSIHVLRHTELGYLRAKGVDWLRAMLSGVQLSFRLWLASISCVVLCIPLGRAQLGDAVLAEMIVYLPIFVLSHLAAWRLFSRRPLWLRLIVRACLLLSLAAIGCLFVNREWDRFYGTLLGTLPSNSVLDGVQEFGRSAMHVWPITVAGTFASVIQIAVLARHRWSVVFFLICGACLTWLSIANVLDISMQRTLYYFQSDVLERLPGPTGTLPHLWMVSLRMLDDSPRWIRSFTMGSGVHAVLALLGIGSLLINLVVGFLFWRLANTLTRAIQLSQPPAPNSRP